MKICLVHNEYGKFSGEEAVVVQQHDLLQGRGHVVEMFTRTSADIADTIPGKARAFFSGIYNPSARKAFRRVLESSRPDLVHVHNLFPLISPSILPECRRAGIPVVMTLHNFRLVCPNALLFTHGKTCHRCLGGRERRCVARNCEGSLPKSLGYALRTAFARRFRWFLDNVDVFICLTEFQRQIHISQGFPSDRCVVIPNFVGGMEFTAEAARFGERRPALHHCGGDPASPINHPPSPINHAPSPYVLYVGRVSPEKDVPTLLEAARLLPDISFKIAGSYWRMPDLPKLAPPNMRFLGELPPPALSDLYHDAAFVVFPTRWYEGLPMVLLEAMEHARPVVCTNIGGLSEIVGDRVTGRLCQPGDARQLADTIRELWQDPALCATMGEAGRSKVSTHYSPTAAYDKLMAVYEMARDRNHAE